MLGAALSAYEYWLAMTTATASDGRAFGARSPTACAGYRIWRRRSASWNIADNSMPSTCSCSPGADCGSRLRSGRRLLKCLQPLIPLIGTERLPVVIAARRSGLKVLHRHHRIGVDDGAGWRLQRMDGPMPAAPPTRGRARRSQSAPRRPPGRQGPGRRFSWDSFGVVLTVRYPRRRYRSQYPGQRRPKAPW